MELTDKTRIDFGFEVDLEDALFKCGCVGDDNVGTILSPANYVVQTAVLDEIPQFLDETFVFTSVESG